MDFSFDPAKNLRNLAERGLSFEQAAEFEFETSASWIDQREDYGETRWISLGFLHDRLHVLCYVNIPGGIRVISFRKANDRERRLYEQAKAANE